MDYTTTPESAALIASAQRLVRERYAFADVRATLDAGRSAAPERWRELAELGWLGTCIDADAGGLGLPYATLAALVVALGPAAMTEPFLSQVARGGHVLARAARGTRRDDVLAAWLAGAAFVALADHGDTEFVAAGNAYRLGGRTRAVVDGGLADWFVVPARQPASGAWVLWLVEARAPGVRRVAHRGADGRSFADVWFDDVALDDDAHLVCDTRQVLAEVDALFALLLAGESLGILRALVPMTANYLAERRQFGRPLLDFQVLQHRLVDMEIAGVRAESGHELARYQCDALGLTAAQAYVAVAKALCDDAGKAVAEEAVQMHGGIGMTADLVIGHYLKRVTANALLGGATAYQYETAARLRGLVPST